MDTPLRVRMQTASIGIEAAEGVGKEMAGAREIGYANL